ncbi:hypothetical protein SAMN04488136_1265 [Vibrio xiamenensis]|uniref:DUF4276 family protein n=1 Tax=Vibrio xiamenensis TaxID=861298 RepID=A0A1G8EQB3_9VIBR|nr:hypothetical protein [Vibrio xiamenensis]SDH72054.1 hypothetical protein SAMN04488136_1265 [Vibrio xiamenensis]
MKKLKYLLVCEGPTDVAFLKRLSSKLGKDLGAEVTIQELSPQRDATTGEWPAHGWNAVRTWCKSWRVKSDDDFASIAPHFVELAKRRTWKALVKTSADGLIIQMDTDIAEHITDLDERFPNTALGRREFCEKALFNWINESETSEEKPVFLLPSYAMETWLLALYDPSENVFSDLGTGFNYEEIVNLEDRLISLGFSSKKKKGVDRLAKKDSQYLNYADRVYNNFQTVKSRCSEAEKFECFLIESIRNQ